MGQRMAGAPLTTSSLFLSLKGHFQPHAVGQALVGTQAEKGEGSGGITGRREERGWTRAARRFQAGVGRGAGHGGGCAWWGCKCAGGCGGPESGLDPQVAGDQARFRQRCLLFCEVSGRMAVRRGGPWCPVAPAASQRLLPGPGLLGDVLGIMAGRSQCPQQGGTFWETSTPP